MASVFTIKQEAGQIIPQDPPKLVFYATEKLQSSQNYWTMTLNITIDGTLLSQGLGKPMDGNVSPTEIELDKKYYYKSLEITCHSFRFNDTQIDTNEVKIEYPDFVSSTKNDVVLRYS